MKYGLALSVIHNAPASNTSSGLTHIIPVSRGPLNTQESRRQQTDCSERNFGEFSVLEHRQRPEFLLRFDGRSSVAAIKTASPELGDNVELLAHTLSFLRQHRPPPPALKEAALPGQSARCRWLRSAARIRLCFAPEQVRLCLHGLYRE